MDEMNYVATAISVLGEKIDSLEADLRMKKWNIRDLEAENKKLKDKLEELKQAYTGKFEKNMKRW